MNKPGKYFVTNNGDSPERIFFNLEDAVRLEQAYIDIFDEDGIKVQTYEMDYKINEYLIHEIST
jgi:hypothetical protein